MDTYEKLGVFYLGKEFDLSSKKIKDDLVLYDSKDLVTHAVCVGMTGSGKTGLCIALIEEAAIDGVPALLIDPKGDLCNLLLTFPQLRGEDFLPWINEDDARTKGLSPKDFADGQAALWKKGLGDWGQSGERIQRLKDAADFKIYTPGSSAGIPVSILSSFAAPGAAILEDNELMQDRVSTMVTSLLGLAGIQADPVQSREHILLSTIVDTAWRQGQNLDLAALIQAVQAPPVTKIGVLDIESFYPSKDRFTLVMALNNLLASPGFKSWMEGVPLDIGELLHTPEGKPRIAVMSIAHLSDSERMFFVSLLMNQVVGWMRSQSGTTSLRAIVYMDEIFGYLPPVQNPPSKLPMMTLLKQARAFGVGLVLATQNPVDLDYKALSNTGTWFIGRLQTERDKSRLLDGLEGAAVSAGSNFSRDRMEKTMAGLGSRVFLMNNTHEDQPVVFQSRWDLSYLRGPLTRDQIKKLMDPVRGTMLPEAGKTAAGMRAAPAASAAPASAVSGGSSQAPSLAPDIPRFFVPVRGRPTTGGSLIYQPMLLGAARVRFSDVKTRVDVTQNVVHVTPFTDSAIPVSWDQAEESDIAITDLEKTPQSPATFANLPSAAGMGRNYAGWNRDYAAWLYGAQKISLLQSPSLGLVSNPGESERDFRVRLQQGGREQRDDGAEKLRQKYAAKLAALQDRLRRAQQAKEREATQAKQAQLQSAISLGATLLSAFTGRKTFSSSTISRAATTVNRVGKSFGESQDIARANETVEAIQAQINDLQAQFNAEAADLAARSDPAAEQFTALDIRPKKTDIAVQVLALVWLPYFEDSSGSAARAW